MFENKNKVVNRGAVHARVYYAKDNTTNGMDQSINKQS